ncbi:hypothetical protein [Brevibacillus brevis]|nr:hypothetical protein [Brevibacillus brevis]
MADSNVCMDPVDYDLVTIRNIDPSQKAHYLPVTEYVGFLCVTGLLD